MLAEKRFATNRRPEVTVEREYCSLGAHLLHPSPGLQASRKWPFASCRQSEIHAQKRGGRSSDGLSWTVLITLSHYHWITWQLDYCTFNNQQLSDRTDCRKGEHVNIRLRELVLQFCPLPDRGQFVEPREGLEAYHFISVPYQLPLHKHTDTDGRCVQYWAVPEGSYTLPATTDTRSLPRIPTRKSVLWRGGPSDRRRFSRLPEPEK